MLTQLRLAGSSAGRRGVVFGELPGCDEPGGEPTARATWSRDFAARLSRARCCSASRRATRAGAAMTAAARRRGRASSPGRGARSSIEEAAVAVDRDDDRDRRSSDWHLRHRDGHAGRAAEAARASTCGAPTSDVYPPMSDFLARRGHPDARRLPRRAHHRRSRPRSSSATPSRAATPNSRRCSIARSGTARCPRPIREHFLWGARSIVIAGTHGKTTTTALTGWLLTARRRAIRACSSAASRGTSATRDPAIGSAAAATSSSKATNTTAPSSTRPRSSSSTCRTSPSSTTSSSTMRTSTPTSMRSAWRSAGS